MFIRIRKFYNYLKNYKRNRLLLRMLDEKTTYPLLAEYYRLCMKYSNEHFETEEQILSRLIIDGHSIEKGLAQANLRFGFGQKKVKFLISLCNLYLDKYQGIPSRLSYVIGILREYEVLHDNEGQSLDDDTRLSLESLFKRFLPSKVPFTRSTTKQEYFSMAEESFPIFSSSRHSVRDFTGAAVDSTIIQRAVELAQNAPSACNRQATRVYCVYNDELRAEIAFLQNNAHGFVDFANPILVVTTELQDWGTGEQWYGGYVDGGIYLMNLLYSLHYYRVAAIPLNWYAGIEKNNLIHELLEIPESQVVIALIGCGYPKDSFKLVTSQRREAREVLSLRL